MTATASTEEPIPARPDDGTSPSSPTAQQAASKPVHLYDSYALKRACDEQLEQMLCDDLGYRQVHTASTIRIVVMLAAVALALWNYFLVGSTPDANSTLILGSVSFFVIYAALVVSEFYVERNAIVLTCPGKDHLRCASHTERFGHMYEVEVTSFAPGTSLWSCYRSERGKWRAVLKLDFANVFDHLGYLHVNLLSSQLEEMFERKGK